MLEGGFRNGANSETQACTAAGELCDRPLTFALAAAALTALWIMVMLASARLSNSAAIGRKGFDNGEFAAELNIPPTLKQT
jgi:hypothetical protein